MTLTLPLNMNFSEPALVDIETLAWEASPLKGVKRRKLERLKAESGHTTSIVQYAPNSHFNEHTHTGGEEYWVLEGTFSDNDGDFTQGTYVRNPPGSRHAPFTEKGCTIFVKLCQMQKQDEATLRINTNEREWLQPRSSDMAIMPLFNNAFETVQLNQVDKNMRIESRHYAGGFEFLLLSGQLTINDTVFKAPYWGRFPAGSTLRLSSDEACVFWSKEGHLTK